MSVDTVEGIVRRVDALKRRHERRDARALQVREVRHGNFDAVAPDLFSDEWPRPIVANRIDVMARHASAALSPLPSFTCSTTTSASDAARKFADRRTKIANHYVKHSRLQSQMQTGADQFYTYGLLVTSVDPDLEEKFPLILMEDSIGVYPAWDRRGRTVEVAHVFTRNCLELCAEFPEVESAMYAKFSTAFHQLDPNQEVEVVKYVSASRVLLYVPELDNATLVDSPNPLGRCTYVCTQKPGLDREIRGAFDDLIWVQLALHAMQTYTLAAAAEAVQAPIAVPMDVHDIEVGPGAVIRTNNPRDVQRVSLDVPQGAFAASQYLSGELDFGAIVPEALGGSIDASVVTGKGVQQLMAGYSQQIANCQQSLVGHFEQVLELCFAMDETFWPGVEKHIRGAVDATPYDFTYTPVKDINGDWSADVQYGGVAGLDPNRALVFLLQAQGAGLVSKDYVRRNLPSSLNPQDEENKIVVEQARDAGMTALAALPQLAPQLLAQGADPAELFANLADAIVQIQKGKPIEQVLTKLFPKPEPQPAPAAPAAPGAAPEGAGLPGEPAPEGGPAVQPPPEGRPDLQLLFAGMSGSGNPNLQAGVSRMLPTQG